MKKKKKKKKQPNQKDTQHTHQKNTQKVDTTTYTAPLFDLAGTSITREAVYQQYTNAYILNPQIMLLQ